MKTLYNITFLIPAALLEEVDTCVQPTARISIHIDDVATSPDAKVYHILFLKRVKHACCLAVSASTASNMLLHDAMLALFNHPKYIIKDKKPEVILIHEAGNAAISPAVMAAIQEKAQAQGWSGVHFINFFKTPYGIQREGTFSVSIKSVEELKTVFEKNAFADISIIAHTHLIVQVDDVQLVPIIEKELRKWEEALIEKNPKIYDVYIQLMRTTKELQEAKEQLQFSHQQVESLKRYNAILKSEEQTRRILEFYHSEYEVLPLWYKRFGHIIKVLTGKRSFKSLFDDKAKKGKQ